MTGLYLASHSGHLEVAQLLLDSGANANAALQVDWPHARAYVLLHTQAACVYTLAQALLRPPFKEPGAPVSPILGIEHSAKRPAQCAV